MTATILRLHRMLSALQNDSLAIDTPGVLSVGVRALDESRVVYLLIEPVPGNFSPGASGVGKVTLTTPQGVRRDEALRRLRGWLSRGRESDAGDFDDVRQAPMTSSETDSVQMQVTLRRRQ